MCPHGAGEAQMNSTASRTGRPTAAFASVDRKRSKRRAEKRSAFCREPMMADCASLIRPTPGRSPIHAASGHSEVPRMGILDAGDMIAVERVICLQLGL